SSAVKQSEIILPSQAVLLSSDNHQFVWVVKNGKAQRKEVVADELSANGVYVRSGLVQGDSIIVAGMQKVSTGTEVAVVK
ncbi:MAG: efflux RND transporter periplasmic adaptor subunit, partial [Muribaculaceae bacterium]|nr:efflux RND transporter periplasmic adaptor subunit [Muribaculaceae bacterium]